MKRRHILRRPRVAWHSASEVDLVDVSAAFHRDGFARLGRLFDEPYLAALRARADALMLGEIRYDGLFFQHDSATGRYEDLAHGEGWIGPSLEYRKLEKLELDPLFRAHVEHTAFEPIVRAFIEGDVAIYRAVLFNKSARGGSPLPWHQDGGSFWGVDPAPFLQVWTALDDCTPESGCLEVIPGSHADGLATPLGGVVPDDVACRREGQGVLVPAAAGEAMLVHNYLWHRAAVNESGHPRRTVTIAYMTAATRCLRKRRAPRTFFRVRWG